jgi:hypothetical protein
MRINIRSLMVTPRFSIAAFRLTAVHSKRDSERPINSRSLKARHASDDGHRIWNARLAGPLGHD